MKLRVLVSAVLVAAMLLASSGTTHAAGYQYVKYSWSPNVYRIVVATNTAQRLTYSQWQAAGFPTPTVVPWINGSMIFKYGGSGNSVTPPIPSSPDLTIIDAVCTAYYLKAGVANCNPATGNYEHVLTLAEWQATGYHDYTVFFAP